MPVIEEKEDKSVQMIIETNKNKLETLTNIIIMLGKDLRDL